MLKYLVTQTNQHLVGPGVTAATTFHLTGSMVQTIIAGVATWLIIQVLTYLRDKLWRK